MDQKKGLVSPYKQANDGTHHSPPVSTLKRRYMEKLKAAYESGGWPAVEEILSRTWDDTPLDELTTLLNRKIFFKLIKKIVVPRMLRISQVALDIAEVAQIGNQDAMKNITFGSVVYIDMDKFKSINERFGHGGGDEVLRVFGSMIQKYFREDDLIGRVGGDEFIVVAVGLSKRDVRARMYECKKEFEKYAWKLELINKEDATNEEDPYKFSFSFNVLRIEDPNQFEKLMHKADTNVLQQKQKRDRRHGAVDI